jgi:hypothetical protein
MRTRARIAGWLTLALALLIIGVGAGVFYATHRDAIQPVRVSQYYGVALGMNEQGEFCIKNSTTGERCGIPRLAAGAKPPPNGAPVSGGFARIPRDSSDLPAPSWLWLTELACGWEGTEGATHCP